MFDISRRRILQASGTLAVMPAVGGGCRHDSDTATKTDVSRLPRVKQELVDPPFVPEHEQVATDGPKIVEVELVAHEGKRVIDGEGTEIDALMFNGSIPGPLIICREGDYVELTLKNPAGNLFKHNIDFHASTGALGGGAMKAKVGETVLFIHSQANRDSRPHLIGGHGNYVWEQGSFADPPAHGLETWFIRGGSAGAAIYTFRQPGIYAYLTHNLIEAVELGALAHVEVDGEWDDDLMTQVQAPAPIPA